MTFETLSPKQKTVFKWCYSNDYKALICDGSVRSGKTISMVTSFILWAMGEFNGATFGICGKTVQSAERNIVTPLQGIVDITHYYSVRYTRSNHCLTVSTSVRTNRFYVFGGNFNSHICVHYPLGHTDGRSYSVLAPPRVNNWEHL